MAIERRRSGFALTAMELRTLIVLALLLIIGLVGKQVKRWQHADQPVVIQGTPPAAESVTTDENSAVSASRSGSGSVAPSPSSDVPSVLREPDSNSEVNHHINPEDRIGSEGNRQSAEELSAALETDQVQPRLIEFPEEEALSVAQNGSLSDKYELNAVTAEQLESIPGIGPVLARRVLEWRDRNGAFSRTEDLLLIEGIGEKRLATMKQYVYVQPQK